MFDDRIPMSRTIKFHLSNDWHLLPHVRCEHKTRASSSDPNYHAPLSRHRTTHKIEETPCLPYTYMYITSTNTYIFPSRSRSAHRSHVTQSSGLYALLANTPSISQCPREARVRRIVVGFSIVLNALEQRKQEHRWKKLTDEHNQD